MTNPGFPAFPALEMFVRQAAEQFRLFTDHQPPIHLMRRVVEERLRAG